MVSSSGCAHTKRLYFDKAGFTTPCYTTVELDSSRDSAARLWDTLLLKLPHRRRTLAGGSGGNVLIVFRAAGGLVVESSIAFTIPWTLVAKEIIDQGALSNRTFNGFKISNA